MKPREYVLEQTHHRETHPVPYSLGFEGDIAAQLDTYYGTPDWRNRLTPYMATVGYIDTVGQTRVDEAHVRDAFGSLIGADTLPVRKPDPAPLFEAARLLGGDPRACILIGDSDTDRNTAKAAGVPSVLVTFGPAGGDMAALEPEALLDDFAALPSVAAVLLPR